MIPQGQVIAHVLEEEPEITTIPITRKEHPLTLLLLIQRKPTERQHQRRWHLPKFQVQRTAHHAVVGNHDGLGQMKMKVRVFRIASGELPVPNMHGFVGLSLGAVCVEYDVIFLSNGMPTEPFSRFEVVAQFVLTECLLPVFELRAPYPISNAVAGTEGTHLVVVQSQHNSVCSQLHASTDHLGISRQKSQTTVHREVNVVRLVLDDIHGVILTPKHWAYQHPKKDNRAPANPATNAASGMFENRHETASKSSQTTRVDHVCCPCGGMRGFCTCPSGTHCGSRCRARRKRSRQSWNWPLQRN